MVHKYLFITFERGSSVDSEQQSYLPLQVMTVCNSSGPCYQWTLVMNKQEGNCKTE